MMRSVIVVVNTVATIVLKESFVPVGLRFGDEPEEHGEHVNAPDGAAQVEPVAKHELPVEEQLLLERARWTASTREAVKRRSIGASQ